MRSRSLIDRCRDEIVPADIVFRVDDDGMWHFGTHSMPLRTIIDIHAVSPVGDSWLVLDSTRGMVVITLDGRTVTYLRVGTTIHGHWVCDLELTDVRDIRQC